MYVEEARLAPQLGSDQMICWALLLSLPLVVPVLVVDLVRMTPTAGAAAWSCFAYTAVINGFLAWYPGLAQPLLIVAASVVLFGQRLPAAVVVATVAVSPAWQQSSARGSPPVRPRESGHLSW